MAVDLQKLAVVIAGSIAVLFQTLLQSSGDGWDIHWICPLIVSSLSVLTCMPAFLSDMSKGSDSKSEASKVPSMFLAVLWTFGAMKATLGRPYALTGNGYFGTWAALIASWLMASSEHASMKEHLNKLVDGGGLKLVVILVASFTALVQTAWSCGTVEHWCSGNASWILIFSAISFILCGMLLSPHVIEKMLLHLKVISLFFLVWWAAGAVVTTFQNPYDTSFANGYFSCWAAVTASAMLVESSWGLSVSDSALERMKGLTVEYPECFALALASLVTFVAAVIDCGDIECNGLEVWAIICSGTSLAICTAMVFHTMRGGWITANSIVHWVAAFLLAWWVLGTVCMTFKGPFHRLGNGYLAAWIALISSCIVAAKHVEALRLKLEDIDIRRKYVCPLFLASLVLFVQAVWDCVDGECDGRTWAIASSMVSVLACIAVAVLFERLQDYFKEIVLGLLLWWGLGVIVLTFNAPYVRTGNAYFACWFALGASCKLVLQEFPQLNGYVDLISDGVEEVSNTGRTASPTVLGAESAPALTGHEEECTDVETNDLLSRMSPSDNGD